MDPNACLQELVRLAEKTLQDEPLPNENMEATAIRLAELVLALDTWIVNGGFLPTDWSK